MVSDPATGDECRCEEPSDVEPTGTDPARSQLAERLRNRKALVGVIGLGYVGLPLAAAAARGGFAVKGFDIDPVKVSELNSGRSYIDAVPTEDMARLASSGTFAATHEFDSLGDCDVIVICVPTPLTPHREPDLCFVEETARTIAARLRPGQLVVLESTTYPGTTDEVLKPILESSGLRSGQDFFLGFSPEREDPGNRNFRTVTIPKIVAGDGKDAAKLVEAFYGAFVERVVPVSSPKVSEAVKITENIFRAVNIALVNELKVGLRGDGDRHLGSDRCRCDQAVRLHALLSGTGPRRPLHPHRPVLSYLEIARVRASDPLHRACRRDQRRRCRATWSRALEEALDRTQSRIARRGARCWCSASPTRRTSPTSARAPPSPSWTSSNERGAAVDYHDPHVAVIPPTREHSSFAGRRSVTLSARTLQGYHAVLIVTDHDSVDYALVSQNARLVVDSRNAMARRNLPPDNVTKA